MDINQGHYQMTLDEVLEPDKKHRPIMLFSQNKEATGVSTFVCRLCNCAVGVYSNGLIHDAGWMIKREACKNGHIQEWEGIMK